MVIIVALCVVAAALALALSGASFLPAFVAPSPTPSLEPTFDPAPSVTPAITPEDTEAPEFVKTAVFIDGEKVGTLASREAAESIIGEILAYYEAFLPIGGEVTTELVNEITFSDAPDADGVIAIDELLALLTAEGTPIVVNSTVVETTIEKIAHTNKTETDAYLVEGTRIVVTLGRDGEKQTVKRLTYVNGVRKGNPEIETTISKEPQNGLIRKGKQRITNTTPNRTQGKEGRDAGALTFIAPVKGSIKENFGQRYGVMHLGLDYTANEGAAVVASCGGTVVSVLVRGGYSLTVEIDHGDGFLTRYAHLASARVKLGDIVAQGDEIGIVGDSKNAEGASLHFELRIDGEAYNPRYYL